MKKNNVPEVRFDGFTEDWKQSKVGEFYFFKNGLNKGKEFFGSGTPIVNFTDVFHNRDICFSKLKGRVQLNENEIKNYEVKKGDIFFTRTSETIEEIGYPSVMTDQPSDTVFSGFVLRGRAINEDPLEINFKRYVFFTEKFREEMKKKSSMTTRALTSGTAIKEMEFCYPKSKEEQERIGNFLKYLDNTIALHQQELTTLQKTKQGFLQKMFPKEGESVPQVRFPGFVGEWEELKLNTVFKDFIVPMRDKPKEFSGSIPWTRIEDIEGRFINGTTSGQYVSEETINSMNLKIIPKGSLIVSASATFGVVAIVNNNLITNQTFIGLVPNTNYNIDYLYAFFKSPNIQRKMKRESAGSTIFYISRKQFENMIGNFPVLEEQEIIGSFFKQLDDIISLHQRELEVLKETKKAFLQKMFV